MLTNEPDLDPWLESSNFASLDHRLLTEVRPRDSDVTSRRAVKRSDLLDPIEPTLMNPIRVRKSLKPSKNRQGVASRAMSANSETESEELSSSVENPDVGSSNRQGSCNPINGPSGPTKNRRKHGTIDDKKSTQELLPLLIQKLGVSPVSLFSGVT